MIYLIINNIQYDVSQLAKTTRLNGVDSCNIVILDDSDILFNAIAQRDTITIYNDDIKVFEGFGEDPKIGIGNISFSAKGKLGWLQKQNLPYDIQFQDYDLMTYLNQNPFGIKFENYGLEDYQIKFSLKFSLESYFKALVQIAEAYGFKFWYNYIEDKCFVGQPNKKITVTDDDILNGKVIIDPNIEFQTSNQANYLQVYGGGIDKLTLSSASAELQNLLGYTISEQENPFIGVSGKQTFVIQDDTSIQTYGVLADSVVASNVDAENLTNEGKTRASNILLILAATEIKARKNPIIKLDNFVYYIESDSQATGFGNDNIFKIDAHVDPNNPNSKLIQEDFYISDISYIFDKKSLEGNYVCTLVNNLPTSSRQNRLLQNISRSLTSTGTGLASDKLDFVTSIGSSTAPIINFSLSEKYKKISKYEMYVVFTNLNATNSSLTKTRIFLDGFEITELFTSQTLAVIGINPYRLPETLNVDILNNSILNASQITTIINNAKDNKHTISFTNDSATGVCNIQVGILIEAEI